MKFNIEFDSSDGSIRIKSGKAPEDTLVTLPTATTTKPAVDDQQNQNGGAFAGYLQLKDLFRLRNKKT